MVAIVDDCRRDKGTQVANVPRCNKAWAGDMAWALGPGTDVRPITLSDDYTHMLDRCELRVPFLLSKYGVICIRRDNV